MYLSHWWSIYFIIGASDVALETPPEYSMSGYFGDLGYCRFIVYLWYTDIHRILNLKIR